MMTRQGISFVTIKKRKKKRSAIFFLQVTFTVHTEPFTMSLTSLPLGNCDNVLLGPSEESWGVINAIYLYFFS